MTATVIPKEMAGHLYKLIASFISALVQRKRQSFCKDKKTSALFIVFDVSSMIGFTNDGLIPEMNDGLELVIWSESFPHMLSALFPKVTKYRLDSRGNS